MKWYYIGFVWFMSFFVFLMIARAMIEVWGEYYLGIDSWNKIIALVMLTIPFTIWMTLELSKKEDAKKCLVYK